MVLSRNKDIPKLKLLINGNEIEQVKSFQYLGALVTEDGRCECELNRRIAVAKNNFAKMSRILTDHDMSLAKKFGSPSAMYGRRCSMAARHGH